MSCNLEQGIISVLGAQAAARIKRETGCDPAWQIERVTSEVLRDLGVPDNSLQKMLTEAYFWQANMMLLCCYENTALQLFSDSLDHSRSKSIRKRIGRGAVRAYAKTYQRQGKILRPLFLNMFLLLAAYCTQLSLAQQLVGSAARRLLQRIPQLSLRL